MAETVEKTKRFPEPVRSVQDPTTHSKAVIKICDYHSYRPVPEEDDPKPRTAEEIFASKQEKERAMRKRKTSTGSELQEDSFR